MTLTPRGWRVLTLAVILAGLIVGWCADSAVGWWLR